VMSPAKANVKSKEPSSPTKEGKPNRSQPGLRPTARATGAVTTQLPPALACQKYLAHPNRRQLAALLRPLMLETWLLDRRAWVEEERAHGRHPSLDAYYKGIPSLLVLGNTRVLADDPPITTAVEVLRDSIVTFAIVRLEQCPRVAVTQFRTFAASSRQALDAFESMGPQGKSKFMKAWREKKGEEYSELSKFAGALNPTELLANISEVAEVCAKPRKGRPGGAAIRPGAPSEVMSPLYQLAFNLIYLWNRFRGFPSPPDRVQKGALRASNDLSMWVAEVFKVAFETARAFGDERKGPTWQTIVAEGLEPALRDFKRIIEDTGGARAEAIVEAVQARGRANLIRDVRRDSN